MSKTTIIASLVSVAAASSLTFLGGTALAWCGDGCGGGGGNTGGNATGGTAENNCLNLSVLDLLNGIGALGGKGSASIGTCSADASAHGGNG